MLSCGDILPHTHEFFTSVHLVMGCVRFIVSNFGTPTYRPPHLSSNRNSLARHNPARRHRLFTSLVVRINSGQGLWPTFLSFLKPGGDPFRNQRPVQCAAHKTKIDLSSPEEFDGHVPGGGCRVVREAKLPCGGGHTCPRRYFP